MVARYSLIFYLLLKLCATEQMKQNLWVFQTNVKIIYKDFYIANKTNIYWKLIYNICYFYRLDCLVFTHLLFCKRKNRFLERNLYYFWFTNTKRRVKLNMRNVFISKMIDLFVIQRYHLLFIQLFFLLRLKNT